jgi:hypothetical protein
MIEKKLVNNFLKTVFFFLAGFWLFSNANSVFGCEIGLKVAGQKKDLYALNDVIDLNVSLEYTHKECLIGLESTKFVVAGLEITDSPAWKEVKPRKFEKTMKLKVIGSKDGKLSLKLVRECELGGGTSSIAFKSTPVK